MLIDFGRKTDGVDVELELDAAARGLLFLEIRLQEGQEIAQHLLRKALADAWLLGYDCHGTIVSVINCPLFDEWLFFRLSPPNASRNRRICRERSERKMRPSLRPC